MRLKQQPGFAMIEAVVAAAVLAIVVLGVLRGLDTAQRSSGREKARSVAAALTEQDQERLRSFRAVDLANYSETRDNIKVNGAPYKVESTADWVRDSTGGTQSCTNSATQADYIRVTSTTSSGLINAPIPPITMSSLVAPPVGAFGANQGTLGVQVNDRDGVGVPNMQVAITGPANLSDTTNSAGCAIFAYVPVGSYDAKVTELGWVDKGGNPTGVANGTVSNGKVNVVTIDYDEAASVVATFDTEQRLGGTASVSATKLAASNSGVPLGPFSPVTQLRVQSSGATAKPSITMTGLFPFSSGYALFAGGCIGADPTKYIPTYSALYPNSVIDTEPGVASAPVVIRLPSINVRVTYGTVAGLPAPIAPDRQVRVTATTKATGCTTGALSEKFTFPAPATDLLGYMVNSALPFGDYDVCVDAIKPGTTSTRITKTLTGLSVVKNRYAQGLKPAPITPNTLTTVDLNGALAGSCP